MGLNFAWDNQNIVNHYAVLTLCEQRLQYLYLTKWNTALSASSDGLIYKSYKKNEMNRALGHLCAHIG